MVKYIQKEVINIFIGIIIGAVFGLLFGWAYSPHYLLKSDWVVSCVWGGTISGAVCGVVVGIINIVTKSRNLDIRWTMDRKFANVIKGTIFGGTMGVTIAAIIGIIKISICQNEMFFVGQIDEIYYIPMVGVILGGAYGSTRFTKWENDLRHSIISGIGFGIIVSVLLSLLMLIDIFINYMDSITAIIIILRFISLLIAMISLSLFGIVVSVVSEAITGRFTKTIIQTKSAQQAAARDCLPPGLSTILRRRTNR